jgi:hypothetical protein
LPAHIFPEDPAMPARFPFFVRRLVPSSLLLLCLTTAGYGSRAPDLARFEARLLSEAKSPALAGYLKEFATKVEREWFTILEESGARPPSGSRVTMHFTLTADGEVDVVGVDDVGSGRAGVWTGIDALQRQQPYGKLTDEMIAAAGRNPTFSFAFYHR